MSDQNETHIFNGRLLCIAFVTAVITAMMLVSAYAAIDFVVQTHDLVNIATTK